MHENMAVQSFCLRGFKDNAEVARLARECGFRKIELCGVHVDFSKTETHEEVIETYRAQGIEIVSIGVERFANNEAGERARFEFARRCGAKLISVDFAIDTVPEAYRTAERLADEYDVKLGIHNHGGRHWLGSSAMLKHVFAHTTDRIGLCLDTAWALDSRMDPVGLARECADRLYGVHVKDFVFDRAGRHQDVVAGEGNLDLPALIGVLKEASFAGPLVVEYEADVDNPVPALKKCAASLMRSLG